MAEEDIHISSPDEDEVDRSEISPLLRGARCMYKVFYTSDRPEVIIDCRVHKPKIKFDIRCASYLRNLGLYHLSQLEHCAIDRRLITALVERWRPETHTFHLPVGEFTVTLQDVSCLWGLPISGQAIIGPSDYDFEGLVESSFGPGSIESVVELKGGKPSSVRISLHLLRIYFHQLRDDANDEKIQRYTRAYVLDWLGSILFPDASGDSVPGTYLRFLQDVGRSHEYNWGAAVLAFLYRQLTDACVAGKKTMDGALLLLQHWSWTWFNIARPTAKTTRMEFGGPDVEFRPPYAVKWRYYKSYKNAPARSSMSYYRNEFENLLKAHVFWQPYHHYIPLAPVSWHYPERVMRQLGLYQTVPPPPPHDWEELRRLDKIVNAPRTTTNWAVKHASYVNRWYPPHLEIIDENRPYDRTTYMAYRRWFQQYGLYTVFLRGQVEQRLDRPLPPPRDSVEILGYVPGGFRLRRMGTRSMQRIKYLIQNLYKRGTRKICKTLLRSHRDDALDSDRLHEFEHVLQEAGLPANVDDINSNDDSPPIAGKEEIPVHAPQPEAEGFRDFFSSQVSLGEFDYGALQPPNTYRDEFPDWMEGPGQSSHQPAPDYGAYESSLFEFMQGSQPQQTSQSIPDASNEWVGGYVNSFLDLNYNPFEGVHAKELGHAPPATSTVAPLHFSPLPMPSDSASEEEEEVSPPAPASSPKGKGQRKKKKKKIFTPS